MGKYTCPCCGYKTLNSEHFYDLCPICFWEDDLQSVKYPFKKGGTNKISLIEGQNNFIKFGACQEQFSYLVRKPNKDDVKDENWKPVWNK